MYYTLQQTRQEYLGETILMGRTSRSYGGIVDTYVRSSFLALASHTLIKDETIPFN